MRILKTWREIVESEADGKPAPAPTVRVKPIAPPAPAPAASAGNGAAAKREEGGADGEKGGGRGGDDVPKLKDPSRRKIAEVLGNAVALAASGDDERRRARRIGYEIEAAMAAKFPNTDPTGGVANGKQYKQRPAR